MPIITTEELPKNIVKLHFTLTQQDARPYLEEAAQRLSERQPIPGFRPGKAEYAMVKQHFGEMKILEEAIEPIVRKSFVQAVLEHNIETVGAPQINVEKLAPDNEIVFSIEVTRMPRIKKLADYRQLSIEVKPVQIQDRDIDLALRDLQRMQTKEIRASADATVGPKDKIVVTINIKKDGVPIEGGQSPSHIIYLTENYYIPGFKEQVLDMKEGEQKTFSLAFPKEHVQKMLAGQPANFDITLKEIYHLEPPSIDDAFAANLGMTNLEMLRETIGKNMREEKNLEEGTRQELTVLELVAKQSQFEEIPDLLVNEEVNKMISELKSHIEEQGLEFETYLKNLKKTLGEMKMDLTPQAIVRIKVTLIMREVAKKEDIHVQQKEVDEELDRLAARYEDPAMKKEIYAPTYREYAEQILKNRKVIEHLKQVMVKIVV